MKRMLIQESGFDGIRCKVKKVSLTGHQNTSNVDLFSQKSDKDKKQDTRAAVSKVFLRIKLGKFLNASPGGEVMKQVTTETNVYTAY
jgi:hypothetical protein